ncbi:MAG: DNA recombination protein RmuC [bacterium]|nr:DNA recombination protein RmuC [bacterium]
MKELIVPIGFLLAGFVAGLLFLVIQRRNPQKDDTSSLMLQQQMQALTKTIDERLNSSSKLMQESLHTQFSESMKMVQAVTERLVKLDEGNKQVASFAEQLRNLQDVLQNPKQRGVFGEYYLETLLQNAFHPKQYQMQYRFKDGEIVDAVLFVGKKLIPIDSKFSLENYNRIVQETDPSRREELEKVFRQDLKNRIEETAKYIRPEEGTLEFAFMFIPAEGIYYDLLVNKIGSIKANTRDLLDWAMQEKHVHIVSPTTFYVTLQALWQGMKAYRIQESIQPILKNIGNLERHLKAHEQYLDRLGAHLTTTMNTYTNATKEFSKIDKDILKLEDAETKLLQENKKSV